MDDTNNVTRDKLISDFKVVLSDAEELLRLTANQAGDKASELRMRVQDHVQSARQKLADAEAVVVDRTKQAARVTDEYVHDHPWKAVGFAAGFGLLLGVLIGRR